MSAQRRSVAQAWDLQRVRGVRCAAVARSLVRASTSLQGCCFSAFSRRSGSSALSLHAACRSQSYPLASRAVLGIECTVRAESRKPLFSTCSCNVSRRQRLARDPQGCRNSPAGPNVKDKSRTADCTRFVGCIALPAVAPGASRQTSGPLLDPLLIMTLSILDPCTCEQRQNSTTNSREHGCTCPRRLSTASPRTCTFFRGSMCSLDRRFIAHT